MAAWMVFTPASPALNRTVSTCSVPSPFKVTSWVATTLLPSRSVILAFCPV